MHARGAPVPDRRELTFDRYREALVPAAQIRRRGIELADCLDHADTGGVDALLLFRADVIVERGLQ